MTDKPERRSLRRVATYQAGITLRNGDDSTMAAPLVAEVEQVVRDAVVKRWSQYDIHVSAMRTDR